MPAEEDIALIHRGLDAFSHVWESRGHFDRFAEERLQGTMSDALGDRARQPEIVERELHSFYARETGRG